MFDVLTNNSSFSTVGTIRPIFLRFPSRLSHCANSGAHVSDYAWKNTGTNTVVSSGRLCRARDNFPTITRESVGIKNGCATLIRRDTILFNWFTPVAF